MKNLTGQLLETAVQETSVHPRHKHRQRRFPDALPRERFELTLPDEDEVGARKIFFAKVKVLKYWQKKAVFEGNHGEDQLIRRASAKLRRRCWRT